MDKALEACRAFYTRLEFSDLPQPLTVYGLHYITDKAGGWYRKLGYCLASRYVNPAAYLTSEPMPEDGVVQWYFVVGDKTCRDYIDTVAKKTEVYNSVMENTPIAMDVALAINDLERSQLEHVTIETVPTPCPQPLTMDEDVE
ncbi:hypothetical protein LXA43DRAFT_1068873 [Ganoderma leucocontextum]|nr:hypothetical protein LXA43DRAFT_1068873 [Ganoderma leucocontextum]